MKSVSVLTETKPVNKFIVHMEEEGIDSRTGQTSLFFILW